MRRALTHVGGEVERGGDPDAADLLARALDVAGAEEDEDASRPHVHGFHAYPARMHPTTAARLVGAFASEGGAVLDPFCGSGTVLVEAMLAGRAAHGADLNPLAVALAKMKTAPLDDASAARLVEGARAAAAHADARRKSRAGATHRFPDADVAAFDPHVLLELDGLRDGIARGSDEGVAAALGLVLSAILVKVSRRQSDTSAHAVARRIAAGYPARLLVKKTQELVDRRRAFTALLPPSAPRARVAIDDATRLATVARGSIDAVVTSPPYAATYDYVAHHEVRLRWLGLDARSFERGELGARRRYAGMSARDAEDAWTRELGATLRAIAAVLRPRAPAILLVADSAVAGDRGTFALRADDLVARAAEGTGLEPIARATQTRPHFHGPTRAAFRDRGRAEHALLLVRDGAARPAPRARG